MYKILHEIKQDERCCTVSFDKNDEYLMFSEGYFLKIYNKNDLNNFASGMDAIFNIKSNDTIIHARFNNSGDSNIFYLTN